MKIIFKNLIFTLIMLNLTLETTARDVTNEEIRDAILSLVHSYNLLDNKLERHEHRERALGELVKRALQSLQKGQKAYEPMNGIFSRLDERVSQIETILIAQEDKYNLQNEKFNEAYENISKRLLQNVACQPLDKSGGNNNIELEKKIEKLSFDVKELMNFYVTSSTTQASISNEKNTEFENKINLQLNQIENNISSLKEALQIENKLSQLDKEFLLKLHHETSKNISNLKNELNETSNKFIKQISSATGISNQHFDNSVNQILVTLANSSEIVNNLSNTVNQSYLNLNEQLEVFNKFDKILLMTSDYVLDTQRKVEYGTHQILQKVGELLRNQYTELNITLQKRFDDIDGTIINNHMEALQNLSSTVESEISHVWRQIEIMHSEISYSKDALNKLQGQTETYVNGTFTTMDSMEGKVSHITERMSEIDSNLNYLLGKLSLVTQEFNQIKIGLGNALEKIRSSFKTVQDNIEDVGPGPHKIPNDEHDVGINLLP